MTLTAGSRPQAVLVDTSAAVALVLTDHEGHEATFEALRGARLGLAGHAAFETFSVLSRLPAPARRSPITVSRVLTQNFPDSRFLSASAAADLLGTLASRGIAGGQVYDALVGATAVEYDAVLATRDARAIDTYRSLGVRLQVIEG